MIRSYTLSHSILIALLALFATACGTNPQGIKPGDTEFVSANPNSGAGDTLDASRAEGGAPVADDGTSAAADRDIEEADIVRVDGDLLYVLNQYRGLQVIDIANPDQPDLVGMADIYGYPIEMYIRGDRAFVLVSNYYSYWAYALEDDSLWGGFRGSQIRVLDISDSTSPVQIGSFDLEGHVTDTRIVGDVLYAVSNRYPWYYGYDTVDQIDGTFVLSINIADEQNIHQVDEVRFSRDGWDNHVHVTPTTIYVASSGWNNILDRYDSRIQYVDISDPAGNIVVGGEAHLDGWIRDRWSMDEHNGVLRVVTAPDWRGTAPRLATFSTDAAGNFTQLASMTIRLPRPESLTAVRFDGDNGYVVTYERVDPLFTLDLSDPSNPVQRGELVMPGWLDHIAPRGDRLVALGRDDSNGQWRLAVSLFDVSNLDAPTLLDRVTFGEDWGFVPDERDNFDKVFKVLDSENLVMVPFHSYGFDDATGFWEHSGGVQLIDFDRNSLTKRGLIDHPGYVKRAIPHGNRILTVSNEAMQTVNALDRDNPVVTGEVELARNVVDFVSLGNYAVQLVGDWYRGDTRLVTVSMDDPDLGPALAEVQVTAPYGRMFVDGDLIYLVSRDWRDGVTQVTVIDYSNPTSPIVRGEVELPEQVSYWYGYWGWYGYGGDELVQVGGDKLVFHTYRYWYRSYDCFDCGWNDPADNFDRLYVVDLSNPDDPRVASTINLRDEEWVFGLQAKGDTLFYTHWESAGRDSQGRSLSRYYLDRIDLTNPNRPNRLRKVNVPGFVVDLSDDLSHVYTLDYAYDNNDPNGWQVHYTFNALRLHGRQAVLRDRLSLDGYVGQVMVRNETAFFTTHDGWYDADGVYQADHSLRAVDLARPWDLKLVGDLQLPGPWGWLRAVEGDRAFIDLGWQGGMLVYDVSQPDDISLADFFRHQGWVSSIRVEGPKAYISLGYYGVLVTDIRGTSTGL